MIHRKKNVQQKWTTAANKFYIKRSPLFQEWLEKDVETWLAQMVDGNATEALKARFEENRTAPSDTEVRKNDWTSWT